MPLTHAQFVRATWPSAEVFAVCSSATHGQDAETRGDATVVVGLCQFFVVRLVCQGLNTVTQCMLDDRQDDFEALFILLDISICVIYMGMKSQEVQWVALCSPTLRHAIKTVKLFHLNSVSTAPSTSLLVSHGLLRSNCVGKLLLAKTGFRREALSCTRNYVSVYVPNVRQTLTSSNNT